MAGNNLDRALADVMGTGQRMVSDQAGPMAQLEQMVGQGYRLQPTEPVPEPAEQAYASLRGADDAQRYMEGRRVLRSLNAPTEAQGAQETVDDVRGALDRSVGPLLEGPAVQDPGPMRGPVDESPTIAGLGLSGAVPAPVRAAAARGEQRRQQAEMDRRAMLDRLDAERRQQAAAQAMSAARSLLMAGGGAPVAPPQPMGFAPQVPQMPQGIDPAALMALRRGGQ